MAQRQSHRWESEPLSGQTPRENFTLRSETEAEEERPCTLVEAPVVHANAFHAGHPQFGQGVVHQRLTDSPAQMIGINGNMLDIRGVGCLSMETLISRPFFAPDIPHYRIRNLGDKQEIARIGPDLIEERLRTVAIELSEKKVLVRLGVKRLDFLHQPAQRRCVAPIGVAYLQNRKYRCAIGRTSAGGQVRSSPSARTS